jgi:hypothetical protein
VPTVESVADYFYTAISSKAFQFDGLVTGTFSTIENSKATERAVAGSFTYKGGDYSWRLVTAPGAAAGSQAPSAPGLTVQYWGVGKYRVQCDEARCWKDDRPDGTQALGLAAVFGVNRRLVDLGIDTFRGEPYHKLSWIDGPGIKTSGIDFQGIPNSGLLMRVYFWASSNGTPIGLTYRISEQDLSGDTPRDQIWNFDVSFTRLSGVKVSVPTMSPATPSPSATAAPNL